MSYQVFARKYRPKTFKDVLGQDHVVQTLRNAIDQDRLAHAYLFVGPRGTGKTSTARILSKALNSPGGPSIDFDPDSDIAIEIAEGRSLDVLEIDGASNNGVEQVRDLRDNVRFAPARCRYKIYYIDEVHMLTTAAFNALLKTLEEPPEHVKFIFATTEPNKILPTIISRCQRFDLRPINTKTIADHLQHIANNEGFTLDHSAAWAVAKGADGGMRDAQSMLDQLVAFCGEHITEENVLDVFGFTSRETVAQLSLNILTKQTAATLQILNQQAESGKELGQLLDDSISCLRALLVAKLDVNASSDGIPEHLWEPLLEASKGLATDRLLNLVDIFADTEARMKWANNKKLHFEIGIIKAVQSLNDARISDVITALAGAGSLNTEQLASTATTPSPVPQTTPAPMEPTDTPTEKTQVAPPSKKVTETVTEASPSANTPVESEAPKPDSPTPPDLASEANTSPEPVPSEPTETVKSPKVVRRTLSENMSSLDAMIANAPEVSEAPTPEPAVIEKQKAEEEAKKQAEQNQQAEAQSPKAELDNDFYNDPLIKSALEIFQATRKPA